MITVKEYAASQGVTIQSVYQQIKRESNQEALKDHITRDEYGTMLLDDEAVAYLSKKSLKKSGTAVIVQNDSELALQIMEKEKEITRLNALVASINTDYLQQLNDVREESSKKIEELMKENKDSAVQLTEANSKVALKEQENKHLQEKIEELQKANQELQAEANKSWWQKLWGK